MKKSVKKLAAVGLTLTSVMSLVACGGNNEEKTTPSAEVTKPGKFTVMVDNTVLAEANGGKEFYAYLQTLTDVEIEWVRPDHTGYYDTVSNVFLSEETRPDVVLLSSDYYIQYAASGFLWDMTSAWENSETKNSGRLVDSATAVFDALKVNGPDGVARMYGFSPYRGNGCCTFVKTSWLEKAGYSRSDVEGKTLTFAQYYEMLKKMTEATGKYALSSPGFIHTEAPYTNYLPEFYQQANYTFYKDASGKYVDGFSSQAMKDALQRIQTAVKDGVLDAESVKQGTKDSRERFSKAKTDESKETGVVTYWAGTWAYNLKRDAVNTGKNTDDIVALNPIKELGTYVERLAPAWVITSKAENPEGIFKYFIDTMLDGGDVQTAWTYGAKGTHWDTKAETVTLKGKEEQGKDYKEGEFHMLPAPETGTSLITKNHIDATLSLAKFKTEDPGIKSLDPLIIENEDWFVKNSSVTTSVPYTEEFGDNIADINKTRNILIADVASGTKTVDQAMQEYEKNVGAMVKTVLDSLNK